MLQQLWYEAYSQVWCITQCMLLFQWNGARCRDVQGWRTVTGNNDISWTERTQSVDTAKAPRCVKIRHALFNALVVRLSSDAVTVDNATVACRSVRNCSGVTEIYYSMFQHRIYVYTHGITGACVAASPEASQKPGQFVNPWTLEKRAVMDNSDSYDQHRGTKHVERNVPTCVCVEIIFIS